MNFTNTQHLNEIKLLRDINAGKSLEMHTLLLDRKIQYRKELIQNGSEAKCQEIQVFLGHDTKSTGNRRQTR